MIIDVKIKQFFYCKETDCSRLITRQTALRGSGRCTSCTRKGDRNPTKNKAVCMKISKSNMGKIISKETRLKISQNHADFSGKLHPRYIDGRTNKKYYCKCGAEIHPGTAVYGKGQCRLCADKTHSEKMKGEGSPNWQGGKSNLRCIHGSMRESKIWRISVFKRDDYTCQICSQVGGKLEAHHKIPFSIILNFCNIKSRQDLEDCKLLWDINWGITLCKVCHKDLKLQGNALPYNFKTC